MANDQNILKVNSHFVCYLVKCALSSVVWFPKMSFLCNWKPVAGQLFCTNVHRSMVHDVERPCE